MIYSHWSEIPEGAWPSRYFRPIEIACRGDGSIKVNSDALSCLDNLRSLLGRPIHLSSAYRSPYRNAACGGAPKSSHLAGIAFDVQLRGHDKEEIRKVADRVGFKGMGLRYNSFIHLDTSRRRTW